MRMQLICLSLILLAVISEGLPGGWYPITDLSDPTVVKIAKFAITEHKKKSKVDLVYEKVVKGETAVVNGLLYDLIIAAKNNDGGATKNYEAIVWVDPYEKHRGLESFKAV